jgi:hypothetical protein
MKKIITLIAALSICMTSFADEGMWLLPLIKKMNGKAMKELGCELTPKQIYSINKTSLKDAIVQFGNGCTGEIISDKGLLVTNHHCGYGNIQKLSSVEHDYLKDGYWAMNHSEELPCEGLTVTFLQYMEDLKPVMEKARKQATKEFKGQENAEEMIEKAIAAAIDEAVAKAEKKNPHCEVVVESFYNENVYYLIVYKVYRDVRFVGAPPSSIGKFGADTDNWMWPRHTGDFSMFRVYADKDGNPADYSPENVPLRPKNHLRISMNGVQEGDFTMIMGYPGRTTRFQTSPELKHQIEQNDIRIAARTIRQDVLLEDMLADPKIKIQYASKYSSSSNGWKKWQGMKLAFDKLDIIGRAEQEEAEFQAWVDANPKRKAKYGTVVADLAAAVEAGREANNAFTKAYETIYKIELTNFGINLATIAIRQIKQGVDTLDALNIAYEAVAPKYADYSFETDRKVAKAMIKHYSEIADTELAKLFAEVNIDEYVDSFFDGSVFASAETLKAAIAERGMGVLEDPAYNEGYEIYMECVNGQLKAMETEDQLAQARQLYTEGLLEWKDGEPSYPDANFTMRLTYGTVGGYSPKDAVIYRYYTTLDGVMEKEDPNNWEFVVPEKLKELWKNKDFGQYAMADGKMPVAFLSNNDITGGNSGSPIMNSRGELIGLAFDGNWESMSSDVMFEPDLQRCINVDIRYVLFIVDKFGGASWLIDEMDLVYTTR